jgi:hypothetical protein
LAGLPVRHKGLSPCPSNLPTPSSSCCPSRRRSASPSMAQSFGRDGSRPSAALASLEGSGLSPPGGRASREVRSQSDPPLLRHPQEARPQRYGALRGPTCGPRSLRQPRQPATHGVGFQLTTKQGAVGRLNGRFGVAKGMIPAGAHRPKNRADRPSQEPRCLTCRIGLAGIAEYCDNWRFAFHNLLILSWGRPR